MTGRKNPYPAASLKAFSRGASAVVALAGFLALLGWMFETGTS